MLSRPSRHLRRGTEDNLDYVRDETRLRLLSDDGTEPNDLGEPHVHEPASEGTYKPGAIIGAWGTALHNRLNVGSAFGVLVGFIALLHYIYNQQQSSHSAPELLSDRRGHIALMYSGTARSFSANFESHIVNLMAGSPYTVHIFFHSYGGEQHPNYVMPNITFARELAPYHSLNSTLEYFTGYTNLDGQHVSFKDAVKSNVMDVVTVDDMRGLYPEMDEIQHRHHTGHMVGYYYMWHSQLRAEQERQRFMKETGISYQWVFRVRYDTAFYTNWWQKAFDIQPYRKTVSAPHDVAVDWGKRMTWLHDLTYEPLLNPEKNFFVPEGWGWAGFNDQFAALSSTDAWKYFTRVLHVGTMAAGIGMPRGVADVHSELSIAWVSLFYNRPVNTTDAGICYSVVRAIPSLEMATASGRPKIECSYIPTGDVDCRRQCPLYDLQSARFKSVLSDEADGSGHDLQRYLYTIRTKNSALATLTATTSSYFYFYRYVHSTLGVPCLRGAWPDGGDNPYRQAHYPFVTRSQDLAVVDRFRALLACGEV